MYNLFAANSGLLRRTLHLDFTNPTFLVPISHLPNLSKTLATTNSKLGFILDEVEDLQSPKFQVDRIQSQTGKVEIPSHQRSFKDPSTVQISHPWPEWVELMERLLKFGYFEGIGNPFGNHEMGLKDSNQIRTACLNFGRERSDLVRRLSRRDIQVIAGSGCPSIDRKVVNSGKRLRAHVGVDEGNVCSSCILRGNCERAFVKAHKDEYARTVDVMRLLVTYGLDPITGTVENKPCLNKRVKESVRRLLNEMVEFSTNGGVHTDTRKATPSKLNSPKEDNPIQEAQTNVPMKQGDWICPNCKFLNFARNVKCLRCDGLFQERLRKLAEDQDHLPLKKGDWICDKCYFLNFAKNTRCIQCKEKPPKRELNLGEWECDSCNYINFRKNMVCLKCDYNRPKASNYAETSAQHSITDGSYPRSHPSVVRERQSGNRDVNSWTFVEDGNSSCSNEHEGSYSTNEMRGVVDFPITGGKTDLSRDVRKQERWKTEMVERSRSAVKAKGNAHDFKSAIIQGSNLLECTDDDEEMAEWFGRRKE